MSPRNAIMSLQKGKGGSSQRLLPPFLLKMIIILCNEHFFFWESPIPKASRKPERFRYILNSKNISLNITSPIVGIPDPICSLDDMAETISIKPVPIRYCAISVRSWKSKESVPIVLDGRLLRA